MNYEYIVKWFEGDELTKGMTKMMKEKWEPLSHAFDNNDLQYSIMFRRALFSEDTMYEQEV